MIKEIYINLDDSGKLTTKENIAVYGGLVFLSKKQKDKFITQYRSIINDVKCKYCQKKDNCNHHCPEIKNTNILAKHKRRIMNYLKKYFVIALIIQNKLVYKHIILNKAAKGRFLDYSLRRLIKEVIKTLLNKGLINAHDSLKIIINIDEQSTKNNGYYNLHDGLIEELKYGIANFNYDSIFTPIILGNLTICVNYQNSHYSYVIQAADLLAGTIRKTVIQNTPLSTLVDFKIILP